MAYITREDGEHFVIPSYREVLSAKQKSVLKKDVLLLSQSYGEYITLQRKSPVQYEIAFSPDTGYLLGETVWSHFKRPNDLIYCEAIPGTTEAILVIVKDGSVYLDGSFPVEGIPEELIVFLTQENHFEIYTYGDVPISQEPEAGKFNFEASVVKSFTVLDKPVFQSLPLMKQYQLQLVDVVLKANGIGVFPVKQLAVTAIGLGMLWMMWSYMTAEPPEAPPPQQEANPYLAYNDELNSFAPDQEMQTFVSKYELLFTMPGWTIKDINYGGGSLSANVISGGPKVATLIEWGKNVNASYGVKPTGIVISMSWDLPKRPLPENIYSLKSVIAILADRLSNVYPGNNLNLGEFTNKGVYTETTLTLNLISVTPVVLALIGEQFKDLPLVLQSVAGTVTNGSLTGTITIKALGT